ncbi:zf-HC2 domain-containing protein [Paramicrobacterium fandaimingii]|uniref:zf-HC2 domain-containing protein n=1 Tax=Paramicrobacterium fandaimingii TaxID=2708079 RepID=UPI001423D37B|nr:zf-HC2 domain-containing protein [Microbacterium fandaimingii]
MTDCGCAKARRDLEEFLRNEICHTDASDIREHLADCADCTREALLSRTLTETVQRACRETAPEELRAQVIERLRTATAH